jgi:hypothetical protein
MFFWLVVFALSTVGAVLRTQHVFDRSAAEPRRYGLISSTPRNHDPPRRRRKTVTDACSTGGGADHPRPVSFPYEIFVEV